MLARKGHICCSISRVLCPALIVCWFVNESAGSPAGAGLACTLFACVRIASLSGLVYQ